MELLQESHTGRKKKKIGTFCLTESKLISLKEIPHCSHHLLDRLAGETDVETVIMGGATLTMTDELCVFLSI